MGWQPIKTAPQTGEACLIYCPDADEPRVVLAAFRRYENAEDPADVHEAWYDFWEDEGGPVDVDPSHWMPLPDPPEKAER